MEKYTEEILIERPDYTNKLMSWFGQYDLVKIITGVRRCGKSKLFTLFQRELIKQKKVSPKQIISINLDSLEELRKIGLDYNDNDLLTDYYKLLDYILERIDKKKINYVFIDEIQLLDHWERLANTLRLNKNIDLYLTGSNAYMFSKDLANTFGGRYVEIKILPFSFKEYCSSYTERKFQKKLNSFKTLPFDPQELYGNYIKESGFPQVSNFNSNEDIIHDYLINTVYLNTVQKDIIKRFNISDLNKLSSVIRYMFDNIGNETSLSNIVKGLSSSKNPISTPTLDNYIKGLLDSFLLYRCDRYDIKGKKYLNLNSKYYVVDVGLRYTLLEKEDRDLGHILENVVYLELLRRGYRVSVGKIDSRVIKNQGKSERKNIEVDFIAKRNVQTEYYQVALNTLGTDTLDRELSSLEEIKDNYPKYLLSTDFGEGESRGIKRVNVFKWLLGK